MLQMRVSASNTQQAGTSSASTHATTGGLSICMSYNDILNDTGLRTLKERRNVLCMKYFAGIQGSAHKLNGLLPALRKVDYDLRPGFNRYPLARYRTNIYGNSLMPWGLRHWQ